MSRVLDARCCPRAILIPLQTSPGQDCTWPYPTSGIKHVRHSHSMCDLSGHMTRTAEATAPPNKPPPSQSIQPGAADVVPPDHEPVASPSAPKLHCREARIPLSTSAANIRAVPHGDFDEPSDVRYRRTSTSYDWLFNSPSGQRPHDFRAEALDLIGPDPFRWVPTRAHVSELQRSLQVPESTASGALRLTASASHGQLSSNSKVKRYKIQNKRRQEDIWWVPERPAFTKGRGEDKGKAGQIESNQYPQTRL